MQGVFPSAMVVQVSFIPLCGRRQGTLTPRALRVRKMDGGLTDLRFTIKLDDRI